MHTEEGKGARGHGVIGSNWGKSSVVLLSVFKKLPFGVVLPAEWLSVHLSPLGCEVYRRHIFLCECYFRERTGVCFQAESGTAVFVVRCV